MPSQPQTLSGSPHFDPKPWQFQVAVIYAWSEARPPGASPPQPVLKAITWLVQVETLQPDKSPSERSTVCAQPRQAQRESVSWEDEKHTQLGNSTNGTCWAQGRVVGATTWGWGDQEG